jgi:hypothetical protein
VDFSCAYHTVEQNALSDFVEAFDNISFQVVRNCSQACNYFKEGNVVPESQF